MNLHDLFIKPYESYSTLQISIETIATIFGIWSVYFSIKKNIWVYPTGLISTGLYIYICYTFGLYGDSLINFYYTVMSIYGWISWSKHTDDNIHINVERATPKDWLQSCFLFLIAAVVICLVYYYQPFINNGFSSENLKLGWHDLDWANWVDVLTSSTFLVGMWLMARRKLENWIFWIIGDFLCIPMMIYKGLGITSIQYIVFTTMAIIGYMEWKKAYHQQQKS